MAAMNLRVPRRGNVAAVVERDAGRGPDGDVL